MWLFVALTRGQAFGPDTLAHSFEEYLDILQSFAVNHYLLGNNQFVHGTSIQMAVTLEDLMRKIATPRLCLLRPEPF